MSLDKYTSLKKKKKDKYTHIFFQRKSTHGIKIQIRTHMWGKMSLRGKA